MDLVREGTLWSMGSAEVGRVLRGIEISPDTFTPLSSL